MTPVSVFFCSKSSILIRTTKKMFIRAKFWNYLKKLVPWLGIFLDEDTRAREYLYIIHPWLGIFSKLCTRGQGKSVKKAPSWADHLYHLQMLTRFHFDHVHFDNDENYCVRVSSGRGLQVNMQLCCYEETDASVYKDYHNLKLKIRAGIP